MQCEQPQHPHLALWSFDRAQRSFLQQRSATRAQFSSLLWAKVKQIYSSSLRCAHTAFINKLSKQLVILVSAFIRCDFKA